MQMKKLYFITSIGLALIFSCVKSPSPVSESCLDAVLEQYDMVPFVEDSTLYSYYEEGSLILIQYRYNGEEYFSVDWSTANSVPDPFDCAGEYLFRNGEGALDPTVVEALGGELAFIAVVGIRN